MKRACSLLLSALLLISLLSACKPPFEPDAPTNQPEQSSEPTQSIDPTQGNEPLQPSQPVQSDKPAPEKGPSIILEDVYQSVLAAQEGNEQEPLILFPEGNPDALNSYYPGLSNVTLTQQAYYTPPVFGHACEILLVEVADKKDVDTVKEILQARIDQAASDTAYPENAEPWARNAQIQVSGTYLCMIVLPDGYTIPENIFDLG